MSLKKTDMERLKAASLHDQLRKSAPPEHYAQGAHAVADLLERALEK